MDFLNEEAKTELLARLVYGGASFHKLGAGDYALVPPQSPRPSKSVCDDLRPVLKDEAERLFRQGIKHSMISKFAPGSVPKYVWAVDEHGEVYEAKTKPDRETAYHGYRLSDDDRDMRESVLKEWKRRC